MLRSGCGLYPCSNSLKQVRLVFCLSISATLKMEDIFYFFLSMGFCEDLWNNKMYFLLMFNASVADDVSYPVYPQAKLILHLKVLSLLWKIHRRTLGNHFKILHGFGLLGKWLTCFRHHSAWDSSNPHFSSAECIFHPQHPAEVVLAVPSSHLLILLGPFHWPSPWNSDLTCFSP